MWYAPLLGGKYRKVGGPLRFWPAIGIEDRQQKERKPRRQAVHLRNGDSSRSVLTALHSLSYLQVPCLFFA